MVPWCVIQYPLHTSNSKTDCTHDSHHCSSRQTNHASENASSLEAYGTSCNGSDNSDAHCTQCSADNVAHASGDALP